MRIKITQNKPQEADCKSIEHLIGQEFEVVDNSDLDIGIAYVRYGLEDKYAIFEGEYEVVDKN
ncbi:hypothetical protein F4V43_01650 [Paenibacillus spiritus]|uniref:Uncharacterized protein n=1 Tax=Paenibacillus spiritus TaxID=2496557 RepID=A0A5J5GGJ1_9BACL|nr:hypothetical protein [Paenibacillus spiritus]KAA9007217.1 hypothetical protein F4V43_01650 [Paenibacillus spiritus]